MQDFSCACKGLYLFNDKTFVDGKESKEYEEVLVNIINGFPLSTFYSSLHSLKQIIYLKFISNYYSTRK